MFYPASVIHVFSWHSVLDTCLFLILFLAWWYHQSHISVVATAKGRSWSQPSGADDNQMASTLHWLGSMEMPQCILWRWPILTNGSGVLSNYCISLFLKNNKILPSAILYISLLLLAIVRSSENTSQLYCHCVCVCVCVCVLVCWVQSHGWLG